MPPRPRELAELTPPQILATFRKAFRPSRDELKRWTEDLAYVAALSPAPNWYFYWHFKRIQETLYRYVLPNAPAGGRVFDLAAYPYFYLLFRRRYEGEIVCTDAQPEATQFTAAGSVAIPYTPTPLRLDAQAPSFAEKPFDLVIFTEVIEHLRFHPASILARINQALKVGGRLVLTTPNMSAWKKIWLMIRGNHPYDSDTFAGDWGHAREYTIYELKSLLEASGFTLKSAEARDVYLNDASLPATLLKWHAAAGLAAMLRFKDAARVLLRGGSTTFIVAEKTAEVPVIGPAAEIPL